jgi:hypothetical protein
MPLHDWSVEEALPGAGHPPGYEIGYDQITAIVNVTATVEASGTPVIACAPHAFDGSPVLAEFFAPVGTAANAAGSYLVLCLFEGSTEIGRLLTASAGTVNSGINAPLSGKLRFTPTVGNHTYTVTGYQVNGNGAVYAGLGGIGLYVPAFIRFTKV